MNSTLALKKADYESEVGDFMGWGRGEDAGDSAWTTRQLTLIRMDVASGLRTFYYAHPWSFMQPFANVTLLEGNTIASLPDDYGGVNGGAKVDVKDESETFVRSLYFGNPAKVVRALAETQTTGSPTMLAMRPVKTLTPGKMQKDELVVFPEADQDYTLVFPYFFTPNYLLDVTQPFALGGVDHHETILECCLAVAELRRDNQLGVHNQKAEMLLKKSISSDQRKNPRRLTFSEASR